MTSNMFALESVDFFFFWSEICFECDPLARWDCFFNIKVKKKKKKKKKVANL